MNFRASGLFYALSCRLEVKQNLEPSVLTFRFREKIRLNKIQCLYEVTSRHSKVIDHVTFRA